MSKEKSLYDLEVASRGKLYDMEGPGGDDRGLPDPVTGWRVGSDLARTAPIFEFRGVHSFTEALYAGNKMDANDRSSFPDPTVLDDTDIAHANERTPSNARRQIDT